MDEWWWNKKKSGWTWRQGDENSDVIYSVEVPLDTEIMMMEYHEFVI